MSRDGFKEGHGFYSMANLLIGVYKNGKFPTVAFDAWAKGLNIEMPIIDFRQSFFDPLAFPIFCSYFQITIY